MKLISDAFKDDAYIPVRYSKRGGNISPPLEFVDVIPSAKSLALICHDPDSTSDFTHWIIWNIDPNIKKIEEGGLPIGIERGVNSWGIHEWGGPQPPSGTHRYIFELYALDAILNLSPDSDRKDLEYAINGHIIESATLTGLFNA